MSQLSKRSQTAKISAHSDGTEWHYYNSAAVMIIPRDRVYILSCWILIACSLRVKRRVIKASIACRPICPMINMSSRTRRRWSTGWHVSRLSSFCRLRASLVGRHLNRPPTVGHLINSPGTAARPPDHSMTQLNDANCATFLQHDSISYSAECFCPSERKADRTIRTRKPATANGLRVCWCTIEARDLERPWSNVFRM